MFAGAKLPPYLPYPAFLLDTGLSQTARELYALILHRATLSRYNDWIDEWGRVYLIYTLEQLSKDLRKSRSTIKKALKELCAADLLFRKHRGMGLANHLYVKIPEIRSAETELSNPDSPVLFPAASGSETGPPKGRFSSPDPVGNPAPSNLKEKRENSYFNSNSGVKNSTISSLSSRSSGRRPRKNHRVYSYSKGESL